MRKILVVEDDRDIARLVRAYLEREGFIVTTASDGKEAVFAAREVRPALVVLDLMLPGMSGLDVCRALRRESDVPIIMLTARVEEEDRLVGLELGADDYVTKPFSPRELVARVRAVLRRVEGELARPEAISIGDVLVDSGRHLVTVGDRIVDLTPTEFELLSILTQNPGRVFTRLQLLESLQGAAYEGYERTIDAHIKNLRQKLGDDPKDPRYIVTVYGVGYKFKEDR